MRVLPVLLRRARRALPVGRGLVHGAIGLALLLPVAGRADVEMLKKEPPAGQIRYGEIVYVDDGTCPAGEVKEITGGSQEKSVPRKVRCVKRPN